MGFWDKDRGDRQYHIQVSPGELGRYVDRKSVV